MIMIIYLQDKIFMFLILILSILGLYIVCAIKLAIIYVIGVLFYLHRYSIYFTTSFN